MEARDETELTLRFSEAEVDISVFEESVSAFLDLVREALGEVAAPPAWRVAVRQGSSMVCARAFGKEAKMTGSVIEGAFDSLKRGAPPVGLSSRGLGKLFALNRAVVGHQAELIFDGASVKLGESFSRAEFLQSHQVEGASFGSLEGVLDGAWVELRREFRIKTFKRSVRCTFPPEMLDQVVEAMGKRALVYGAARYGNGQIVGLHARRIHVIDTPPSGSWRSARGVLRCE